MKIRKFIWSLILIPLCLMIWSCGDDNENNYYYGDEVTSGDPYDSDSTVLTDAGYVAGTTMDLQVYSAEKVLQTTGYDIGEISVGEVGNKIRIYQSIPYAAPPVGNLRWKAPQPVTPWEGIRPAVIPNKWPTQAYPASFRYGSITDSEMSEDCLYLNVLTPAKSEEDRLPVMVWFHGGGLRAQSGSRDIFNTPSLAQRGVVQVNVSHRLNVMGYMAHPALSEESENSASGNYGMLDLVEALKWVQNNIDAFGGDPNNVTIFGVSGGGNKIQWLMTSPLSKGLFHKAICESGYSAPTELATAEQSGADLAEYLGIENPGSAAALEEMRALPWQDLVDAAIEGGFFNDISNETIDGWSQTDSYSNLFKEGKQHDVPFIIGITQSDIPFIYSDTVNLVANAKPLNSPMWAFKFDFVPTNWKADGALAWHALESGYVFGNWEYMDRVNWENYGIPAGATSFDPGFDERDPWMSEFMMQTWIQFAATGNPNPVSYVLDTFEFEGQTVPVWPPHTAEKGQYLEIDYPPTVEPDFGDLIFPQ